MKIERKRNRIWRTFLHVFIFNAVLIVSNLKASDSEWDYASEGSLQVSEVTAGKAGSFRSFDILTSDAPEKVVLWYAKRLGFSENHALVTAAKKGFGIINTPQHISVGVGHDTTERKDHTVLVASITAQHSHIVFLHRPNFNGREDVTISITSSTEGTHITVIRPILGDFRKTEKLNLKKK